MARALSAASHQLAEGQEKAKLPSQNWKESLREFEVTLRM